MKKIYTLIFVFTINLIFSQIDNNIKVAIDPLHGGFDEGFFDSKTNTFEKDITLAVSKKIIDILNSYEKYEIIKLRTSDVFVPMSEKILQASESNANLYIAINCQTDMDKNKRGTQLFTLNKNEDQNAIELSKNENAVINKESGSELIYSDYKTDNPNKIFESIKLNKKYLQLSKDFTSIIRNELNEKRKFNDNGVVEGPFLMLHNVYMPSAIVNIGYLSNQEDLEYLKSELGQQIIAEALVNSIITFKNKLDNDKFDLDEFLKPNQTKEILTDVNSKNQVTQKKSNNNNSNNKKKSDDYNSDNYNSSNNTNNNTGTLNNRTSNNNAKTSRNNPKYNSNSLGSDNDTKYSSSKYYGTKNLLYRVQILACHTCPSVKRQVLNLYSNIVKIHEEGYKKYFIFESLNLDEANKELIKAKALGFTDAFIIGYIGKEKVKID